MPQHPGMRLPDPERVPDPLFATGDAAGQRGRSRVLPQPSPRPFLPASTGDRR